MKKSVVLNLALFLLFLAGVCLGQEAWVVHKNEEQGFKFKVPVELKVTFTKIRDKQEAAAELLPFDYVNFRPVPGTSGLENFELGMGVHWDRDNLPVKAFADRKDDGLRMSGARIDLIRRSELEICGLQGVRDDFRIEKPGGWVSYSRVILHDKDRFFVFLGTLGTGAPIPGYEDIFNKIVDSFELSGGE